MRWPFMTVKRHEQELRWLQDSHNAVVRTVAAAGREAAEHATLMQQTKEMIEVENTTLIGMNARTAVHTAQCEAEIKNLKVRNETLEGRTTHLKAKLDAAKTELKRRNDG